MTKLSNRQSEAVHCAVLRVAREGKELEFERALNRFISRSMLDEDTTGAHVIHPSEASQPREYGILRAFRSLEAKDRFYDSEIFREWLEEVRPLVEGEAVQHSLHGLEAFFRSGGATSKPPRWKMAVITWLGVYPVVLCWSQILGPQLNFLPFYAVLAVTVFAAVITLTWGVMPLLTKVFSFWLHGDSRS